MAKYNIYEEAILRALYYARRQMTASEVASKIGISWQAANKYLWRLYRKKKRRVSKHTAGNRTYWIWKKS